MTVPIKYQPYDSFLERSIDALETQLYDLFLVKYDQKRDKRVYRTNSDSALNAMVKSTGEGKGRFPFITTKVNSFAANIDGGYNSFELRHKGLHFKKPINAGSDLQYLTLHPEPMLVSIGVSCITKDERDAFFFSKRWVDSIKNRYFDFELTILGHPIKIKATSSDGSVSLPDPQELVADTGNLYLIETGGIELHTYLMSTDITPAIKRYHLRGYDVDNMNEPVETVLDTIRTINDIEGDI